MEVVCHNCMYWLRGPYGNGFGDCRRYAPKQTVPIGEESTLDQRGLAIFPQTGAGNYCGEWQPNTRDSDV